MGPGAHGHQEQGVAVKKSRAEAVRAAGFYYKKKFQRAAFCIYCGAAGMHWDHVYPISIAARLDLKRPSTRKILRHALYIVPSCQSCNTIAGAEPCFSIKQKRQFIQKQLKERYRHKLKEIQWGESELSELGPTLRSHILTQQIELYEIERRIHHPSVPNRFVEAALFPQRHSRWA